MKSAFAAARLILIAGVGVTSVGCGAKGGASSDAAPDSAAPDGAAPDSAAPDGAAPSCSNLSGGWAFSLTCPMGGGGFAASVSQVDCMITLVQMDDNTPMTWTSTGSIDTNGATHLAGTFGFSATATACDGTFSGSTWTFQCGGCTVSGQRTP